MVVFENLMALYIAVEQQCPPETAFKLLDGLIDGKKYIRKPQFVWTDKDKEDVVKFRTKGLSVIEISKYYGVDPSRISQIARGIKKSCLSSQH